MNEDKITIEKFHAWRTKQQEAIKKGTVEASVAVTPVIIALLAYDPRGCAWGMCAWNEWF